MIARDSQGLATMSVPAEPVPASSPSYATADAYLGDDVPPGGVYVTGQFAAALELDGRRRYACDHVGHMAAAKDDERLRIDRLRRR